MPVIVKLSLLSLLALFTAVALLLPLAVTAQDSGNDTTNKNTNSTIGSNNDSGLKEQNLTNTGVENNSNAQTTPVERATARPARKPHFIFPDHIMSSVNATMTEKCMEIHSLDDNNRMIRRVGNEESAKTLIAALEAKFTGYHFIVGVYNVPSKKECQTSCRRNGKYNYYDCELVTDCGSENEKATNSAIWGIGKFTAVGTVDTTIPPLLLSNHTTVDNVKASYFVYMTNATRRYEPIAVQTAAKQLAQKNCSDSLASIQKEFQRALSPLGLVAVVVPGNDLQVFTSEGLPSDAFWMGSVLCDTVVGGEASSSSSATKRGFHVVLGATQWCN